jgi:N-methylhydantoinase B
MTMDAITVQVLRNKIASLVDEMHYHFYRSGYSTIIRESRDFSCVVLDRDGRLIVAPPMFFHAPVYRHLVGRILAHYGPDGALGAGEAAGGPMREGDVFVSNHPYEGGLPHVSDMAFVAPVFAGERLVAFTGSIAHKADIGGTVAGSTSANATEIYQEGLSRRSAFWRPAGCCRTSSASFSATAGSRRWSAATWRRRSR